MAIKSDQTGDTRIWPHKHRRKSEGIVASCLSLCARTGSVELPHVTHRRCLRLCG